MSEVLSFILTFSIIVMMVGLLYTAGFGALNDLQGKEQMQNAGQVFLAVSDSFNELQEGQAPKRAGSLDLDVGASLRVANETEFDLAVNGPGFETTLITRSIEYRLEDTTITYETGAVFRSDKGVSVMIGAPPDIYCSPSSNVSVVSIVTLKAPNASSLGSGTATITGIQESSTLLYPEDRSGQNIDNVTIAVSSTREEAWNRYLEDAEGWEDPDGDGTFACESADRVYIRHLIVEIRLSG